MHNPCYMSLIPQPIEADCLLMVDNKPVPISLSGMVEVMSNTEDDDECASYNLIISLTSLGAIAAGAINQTLQLRLI